MVDTVWPTPPDTVSRTSASPPPDGRQDEMVSIACQFARTTGSHETAIRGLHLIRADGPGQRLPAVYEPGVVVVLQGRKQARLGNAVLGYDPLHHLIVSVTMLPTSQIIEASPEAPYLCLRLNADTSELASLLLDAGPAAAAAPSAPTLDRGLQVARSSPAMLDAVLRLLRLLRTPADVPVLAPLAKREIFYRVLTGELGHRLRALAVAESHAQRIARAIELVKRRYAEPLRIDDVAEAAHMSPSSLHLHFKQVTSMSPLQYQKQLRLHHARQLMMAEGLDAAVAAHRVGYESPSQFSREYRRLFGAPPRTEIQQALGTVGSAR
ncbi:MAG TPA: AraC family transcriptional regulator [Ideonella sp.]|uniref:AraC family transcriptional regulator n=1 Tax=Ideonella sp. TaxID=1929293 RepID=UPI002E30846D|nr:AraC family transcriptional regulator [Ideonella sp.]HEX5686167.1 AraC family transcriptional regulator [Ideonella sp.]